MTDGPAGPLPIRPRPAGGETPASYARRLARANHIRPKHLQCYLRAPGGDPGSIRLDWLAVLAGRSLPVLEHTLASPDGRPPRPRTRPADMPALFAAIRSDAQNSRLSITALADNHGVGRNLVLEALASPSPRPRNKGPQRASRLDPFKPAIEEMLQEAPAGKDSVRALTGRIFARLAAEHAMTGVSHAILYQYLRTRLPVRRYNRGAKAKAKAASVKVTWAWRPAGHLQLAGGRLVFPPVPQAAGIYRLTLTPAHGGPPAVHIGDSHWLPRTFGGHLASEAGPQDAELRLSHLIEQNLAAGGRVSAETATQATAAADGRRAAALDMSRTADRALACRAAEMRETFVASRPAVPS